MSTVVYGIVYTGSSSIENSKGLSVRDVITYM